MREIVQGTRPQTGVQAPMAYGHPASSLYETSPVAIPNRNLTNSEYTPPLTEDSTKVPSSANHVVFHTWKSVLTALL
jgi:hypothetical protein